MISVENLSGERGIGFYFMKKVFSVYIGIY